MGVITLSFSSDKADFHWKCRSRAVHVDIWRCNWVHLPDNVLVGKGKLDFLQKKHYNNFWGKKKAKRGSVLLTVDL